MFDLPPTWDHRFQSALDLHGAWNRAHRTGATQEVTSAIAAEAGFDDGTGLLPLFRHGYLVTREDGRWVAAVLTEMLDGALV